MKLRSRWTLSAAAVVTLGVVLGVHSLTAAETQSPQQQAAIAIVKESALGGALRDATSVRVQAVTAGSLRRQNVSVPSNQPSSATLWTVELGGIGTASHGPIGAKPLPLHHTLTVLVDLATHSVLEAYSDH